MIMVLQVRVVRLAVRGRWINGVILYVLRVNAISCIKCDWLTRGTDNVVTRIGSKRMEFGFANSTHVQICILSDAGRNIDIQLTILSFFW